MEFHASGLPNDQTVKDAFNYSYKNVMAQRDEAMKDFTDQMSAMHFQRLAQLEHSKNEKTISDENYNRNKIMLEKEYARQLGMGPVLVERELNRMFLQTRLAPAKVLLEHSENPSPELLATILLVPCVRSPVDYENIKSKFGAGIAGVVAEISHIDSYVTAREVNLAAAGSDTKRVYMALISNSLEQVYLQIQKMQMTTSQPVMLETGQEETLFSEAKRVWDNDKKLSQYFLEAFNRTAKIASSPFRMEVDAASGKPQLVKGPSSPPPAGPGSKGPGGLGDGVF